MMDPKIYLAVDNCFASKRWTQPKEWIELISSLGVNYIEASADNECDSLYMDKDYLTDWLKEVKDVCDKSGMHIANFYSGHGTYTTLGLSHTDERIRKRLLNDWLKPMALRAAGLNAGIGFYCHAFSDSILQDKVAYVETANELYAQLADLANYCQTLGIKAPGVEQMYTPHQIPWTVEGSKALLAEVFQRSNGAPFYLNLDTGHQSGQYKFVRPLQSQILEAADKARNHTDTRYFWLGPVSAYTLFDEMIGQPLGDYTPYLLKIDQEMDKYPYMFANVSDGDTYHWLEELGCYSPIIHLQQTNGKSSAHMPFTEECNQNGVIFGNPLLQAIAKSYQKPDGLNMPPKCEEIYLTLEIFSGTSELNRDIIQKMQDSVSYWRKFIPEDGILLSEAIRNIPLVAYEDNYH